MKRCSVIVLLYVGIVAATEPETILKNSAQSTFYNIIDRAIAPFKSGYGYTEEEKAAARQKIAELKQEKNKITTEYKEKIQNALNDLHKKILISELSEKITNLNNQIHEQKIITGEAMSFKRQLAWAGVGIVAVTVGGVVLYKCFVKAPNVPEVIQSKQPAENVLTENKQIQKQPNQNVKKVEPQVTPGKKTKPEPQVKVEPKKTREPQVKEESKIIEKEAVVEKIEYSPYVSPPLVDPKNLEGLQQRLYEIQKQKFVQIGAHSYPNPNFNREDELMAEKAVETAKQFIKNFDYKPYISPPLVNDKTDIEALHKRLEFIKKQKMEIVNGKKRKNPNYNNADELQAQHDLNQALELQRRIQRTLESQNIISGDILEQVYDFPAYESPARVANIIDVEALKKRYQQIKKQRFIIMFGELVTNPNYNQEDESEALLDIKKAKEWRKEIDEVVGQVKAAKIRERQKG